MSWERPANDKNVQVSRTVVVGSVGEVFDAGCCLGRLKRGADIVEGHVHRVVSEFEKCAVECDALVVMSLGEVAQDINTHNVGQLDAFHHNPDAKGLFGGGVAHVESLQTYKSKREYVMMSSSSNWVSPYDMIC